MKKKGYKIRVINLRDALASDGWNPLHLAYKYFKENIPMNNEMMSELYSIGLIPVIKIENPDDAIPLAKALIDGGLPCAEITFRTAAAKDAIAAITKEYPDMIVGAGTVLTKEQVDAAIEAGSKFIVSPGFNPEIVKYCQEKGCPIVGFDAGVVYETDSRAHLSGDPTSISLLSMETEYTEKSDTISIPITYRQNRIFHL